MRSLQPKKYYDLPQKVFLGLYIANAILALLAIAAVWVGHLKDINELPMTFSAIIFCTMFIAAYIGVINSCRKTRILSMIYFFLFVIHLIGWILFWIPSTKEAGAIMETVAFGLISGFSIYLCVAQKQKKTTDEKPSEQHINIDNTTIAQPIIQPLETKPTEQSIVEQPNHPEQPKVEEVKSIVPVEVKQEQPQDIIEIVHVTME